ncbi:MAG: sulfotransferase [Cyclobacteriaceae bacterium]
MVKLHHKYSIFRNLVNFIIKGRKGVSFDSGSRATPLLRQETYPFDPLKDSGKDSSKYRKVIYICSPTQRSGTNFMCNTLRLHRDIAYPETPLLPNEHFLYSHADMLSDYLHKTIGYWPKWVNDKMSLTRMHSALLAGMGDGVLNEFYKALADPDKILMLRTPDAGNLEYFPAMFPGGKLVVIIRDGRDTVNSFVDSFSGDWAFGKMTKRWADRTEYLFGLYEKMKSQGLENRIQIFRYEELNSQPEQTVRKILKFLRLEASGYDWEKLNEIPVVGSSTQYNKKDGDEFWKPSEKVDSSSFTNKWKDWSPAKKRKFKKLAGKQLIMAGYSTDLNW